ncbi:hypothetical protein BDW62DRAFT_198569 [Aspergillus aurantiobrunneus]
MSSDYLKYIVLFIAWASGGNGHGGREGTREYLTSSLGYTVGEYEKEYGLNRGEPINLLPFLQSSNAKIPPNGEAATKLRSILEAGKTSGRPVALVLDGWDGLTTNMAVFQSLFQPYVDEVDIILSVFAGKPRIFFQFCVRDVLRVMSGEYEDGQEDDTPKPGMEFVSNIWPLVL